MTIERFRAICEANPYLWLRREERGRFWDFLVDNLYGPAVARRESFWEREILAMTPDEFYDRMFSGINQADKARFLRMGFEP